MPTFAFEVGYEVVTNRSVQDVHDRLSLGLGYSVGIPMKALAGDDDAEPRVYEIALRGSANYMEAPDLFSDDILLNGDRELRVKGGANPDFDSSWEAGLDFDAQIPVGDRSYLTVNAGVFDGDPNPWFVRLGVTVPVDGIIGLFKSIAE